MSGIKCTYPMTNNWRESNYIEDQRLQKDNKVEKHQLKKQAIRRSKEQIDRNEIPIWTKEDTKRNRYYDKT
jgi:hypothetical protein